MTSKCFKKTVQFVDVHQETRKKQSYMDGRLTDSCRFASSQSKWSASKNQTLRVRNDGKNHLQQKDHCIVDLKVPASHVDGLRCLCHGVSEIKQALLLQVGSRLLLLYVAPLRLQQRQAEGRRCEKRRDTKLNKFFRSVAK